MTSSPKVSVLWVERERSIRNVLRELFNAEGYEVTVMEAADAALRLLDERAFDLVGTCIRMNSGMTGVDFARHVREKLPDMPVIVLSGQCGAELVRQLREIGVAAYVPKPFKVDNLLTLVDIHV